AVLSDRDEARRPGDHRDGAGGNGFIDAPDVRLAEVRVSLFVVATAVAAVSRLVVGFAALAVDRPRAGAFPKILRRGGRPALARPAAAHSRTSSAVVLQSPRA